MDIEASLFAHFITEVLKQRAATRAAAERTVCRGGAGAPAHGATGAGRCGSAR